MTELADEPKRAHLSARIACLERRLERLTQKIERGEGSERALSFDREEAAALVWALRALRRYRAELEGEDDPVLALSELVVAIDGAAISNITSRVCEAMERARGLLEDFQ